MKQLSNLGKSIHSHWFDDAATITKRLQCDLGTTHHGELLRRIQSAQAQCGTLDQWRAAGRPMTWIGQ